ncbi:amino acid permease [Plantibacter sp. VKM Ac-2885]|uniref:Amino acid/polyamine/organocation transporter, APC superfamily n=2 Tax=Plantibacter TaxID=190323 RepID=A0ABY1LTC6_9MICO|nr:MULTISPECIES: amino acid permease [Plantibacter]AZH84162.1 amino acid permease [Plantibacter sp. PA-3-X8]MBD8468179.1 amino acid permease [Plantibacter sp. CFBP 8798]MBD8516821.1 amino acid permease [Plantibacter sp. CFBP 8804]MBF4514622.1 amino acid permease [Plantibacter sp. VKM Ac-2885]MBF4566751.1 amino acid permease [Plantibacter sp. VKM Ac-2876]
MSIWRTKSIEDSLADSSVEGRSLKRTLGTWDLMIMGVAVAVGAGIFSVGAKAAGNYAGPSVSLAFILAAVTCALAIMCYAEFASTVPVAGSAYTFTYATLGELLAWIIGWDLILEMLTAAAVIAKYWGIYLSNVFLLWGWDVPSELDVFGLKVSWGAFVIVAIFTTLLVLGTKLSSRVASVFTIIKVAIVIFVIVVGAFFVKAANYTPFIPDEVPTKGGASDAWSQSLFSFMTGAAPAQYGVFGLLAGASLVFFAFIGFDVVATSAEEVKNPQRNLPRGIFGGLAIVTVLYVGVSLVLTGMVPYTTLAEAEDPSLATAFIAVGADWAAQVISIGILAGLTTVIMVLLLGLARVVFAMSRDGLLPRSLSVTSEKRKTPVRVQLIVGALVALIAGLTDVGILEEMINIGTLSAFVLVSIAVIVLRKKYPKLPRAFRVPWSPFLPILSAVLCVWLMLNLTTLTWVRFLVWLALGFIIYFAYSRRHSIVGKKARGELVE